MTILAAFRTVDGILLCADTQYTGGSKIHQSKLFAHNFGGGVENVAVAFGLAGNETYGKLAIEEVVDSLDSVPASEMTQRKVKTILKNVTKRVYMEYVDTRPESEKEAARFQLVIGAYLPMGGLHNLFYTDGPALLKLDRYGCFGTGAYLGDYLMRKVAVESEIPFSRKNAALLAIQAIAAVKSYDPYAGGDTQFLSISADGAIGNVVPFDIKSSENYISSFESLSRDMLSAIGDAQLTDYQFEFKLGAFTEGLRSLRAFWNERGLEYMDQIMDELNSAKKAGPQSTTDDLSPPPPSQGSPGESRA